MEWPACWSYRFGGLIPCLSGRLEKGRCTHAASRFLLESMELFCGDVHAEVVLFSVRYAQQRVLGVGMVWVVCGPRFEPVEVVAGVDESVSEVEPHEPEYLVWPLSRFWGISRNPFGLAS